MDSQAGSSARLLASQGELDQWDNVHSFTLRQTL